jgi:hypothetical protein
LETLKWLADYIASMKMNQLQLYVEHTFAFRFDPDIAEGCSPLTPAEILELDQYCRDRRIEFVPSIQSFGHMGHILSLPQYRDLAELQIKRADQPIGWEEMAWGERMHGATIDPSNPESRELLENMYDCFLPLFDSDQVNVCSDETWDLGKGKNAARAEEVGVGRIYIEHMKFLNELSHRYGKRMMFWGDIVKKHPELVSEIPKDAIMLDWGYNADHDFEGCAIFAREGLDLYICPGTSGWNRILNGINNADLNIRRYADAGKRNGAIGLLNTDWGDHGHFSHLSGSLHPIAVGAAIAWNVGQPSPDQFDRAWSAMLFDDPSGRAAQVLRDQSWIADRGRTWIMLYRAMADSWLVERSSEESAQRIIDQGRRAARLFESYTANGQGDRRINAELANASLMNAMLGEKMLLALQVHAGEGRTDPELADRLDRWADQLRDLYGRYEELWLDRNKESNLRDIRRVIRERIEEAHTKARQLR